MEGLVIEELSQDLRRLDVQTLLQASTPLDLDYVLSQVPSPDEIQLGEVEGSQPDASTSSSRFATPVSEFEIQAV